MKYDIIVIGAGPAGLVAASMSRKLYNNKVLIIKNIEQGVIPCGIPYMFKTLDNPEDNALGTEGAENQGVEVITADVDSIIREEKKITTNKGEFFYDKLVLAVGAKPFKPPIKSLDRFGVYFIKKEMQHLKNLKNDIQNAREIVIIGGGFIGIEFADELSNLENKNITIVEFMPRILGTFDEDFSEKAKSILESKGVKILTGVKLEEVLGSERVSAVKLSNGKEIKADLLIVGVGSVPNVELAEKSGLEWTKNGIKVNDFMQTSDKNIFAIGDCAEKHDFVTGNSVKIGLASIASTEARIAAYNLYQNRIKNNGSIAIYSTKIGNLVFSSAGMTESLAKRNNINYVIGQSTTINRHPTKMPGCSEIHTKLIFNKETRKLIGAQMIYSEGELINILGLAIEKGFSVGDLFFMQVATHPKTTAPPTMYPIILAAEDAMKKLNK